MTPTDFRRMALALPETVESSHMGHPDFRVGGKIFATLGAPGPEWGMVKLTPDDQELFIRIDPEGFRRVRGGWGREGATNVRLKSVRRRAVREALLTAWRTRAPRTPKKSTPKGPKKTRR